MFLPISEESRAFMALVGKALGRALTPDEQSRFDQLLKTNRDLRSQFDDLLREAEESKMNEIWERGLRVLLRCPQPEDRPFLESVKQSDRKLWNRFLQGAFVLRVIAESLRIPSTPEFSNALTRDEENEVLAAVNAAKQTRKEIRDRAKGRLT